MKEEKRNPGNEKPISLHPLTLEAALDKLMQVKPEQKETPADALEKEAESEADEIS